MEYSRSMALSVGLDVYQYQPRLPGAARNAEAVASLLRRAYRFEVSSLRNQEATRGAFSREWERLHAAERVVVYFAGRAIKPTTLGLYNTDPQIPTTGLSLDRLLRQFDTLPARHALLILDSALPQPDVLTPYQPSSRPLAERFAGRSRMVFGAGLDAWQSRERWGDDDASPFTAQILLGLRGSAADPNGLITCDLLAAYLTEELPRNSHGKMIPWVGRLPAPAQEQPGDLLFREVAPLELPTEILEGLRSGFPSLRYRSVAMIAALIDKGDPIMSGLAVEKLREVAAENDSLNTRKMAVDELIVRRIDPDTDDLPILRQPAPPRPGAEPPEPSNQPPPATARERRETLFVVAVMIGVAATVIFLILHFS